MWLGPSGKFETGVLDSLFQRRFVYISLVVPLYAKLLTCHIGLGRHYTIQHSGGFFYAGLTMAASHTVYTVRTNDAFLMLLGMLVVVSATAVFMLAATFMVMFALAFAATTVTAATLVGKLRVNHEQRKHSRTNVVEHTYCPVPVTLRRSVRQHRREERIHKKCIHDKAKEHGPEGDRHKVSGKGSLAKGLAHHQHAGYTCSWPRHQ